MCLINLLVADWEVVAVLLVERIIFIWFIIEFLVMCDSLVT